MTRRLVLLAALQSTLCGFVFVAPIMPQEIGGLVNATTGVSAITPGIVAICAVIGLALVFGRTFCGSICPVGSVQELAYALPVKKYVILNRRLTESVRLVVFVAAVVAALYLVDLMAYTGLYDLFALTVSALAIVATLHSCPLGRCVPPGLAGSSARSVCFSPLPHSSAGSGCTARTPVSRAGNAKRPVPQQLPEKTIQRGSAISAAGARKPARRILPLFTGGNGAGIFLAGLPAPGRPPSRPGHHAPVLVSPRSRKGLLPL